MLTAVLIAISIVLAGLLVLEKRAFRRDLGRLEHAISQQDRRLLGSDEYARAPRHIRSLERAIFDQLFTAANLEKSVTRREKLLAAVVDGLGDAVFVTDAKKQIRFANARARELFALTDDITGKPIRHAIIDSQLLSWLDSCHNQAESTRATLEIPGLQLAGSQARSFEVDIAPLQRNAVGGTEVSRIVLHDITERSELERVRKDFVANASHELRTPLTIINGYLENLLEDGAVDDPVMTRKFLGVMRKHGQRLALLVEDMLTISRLESDDTEPIKIAPFNFANCVREVTARLAPVIDAKKASVAVHIPDGQESLHGDQLYWDQILFNLVENALKENDQTGLQLTITKSGNDHETVITVSDDGVGIPKEALPFIFKRFYRVDESHASEKTGTGLGLSIVKRAVEAHSGTIEATSIPGQQTKFTIRVPT